MDVQDNADTKENYTSYQDLMTKSLINFEKLTKEATTNPENDKLNNSNSQSLKTENNNVDECCMIISSSAGKDISAAQYCSSEDNESSSEILDNEWDSSSTSSEETSIKLPLNKQYIIGCTQQDILEVPGIKTEEADFGNSEMVCDSDTGLQESQELHAESSSGRIQNPFPDSEEDECLSENTEMSFDLDKTKQNLSLLEQAIALQAEQGHVFHSTYKELDRFLLEHLTGERRQAKIVDLGGRPIYNHKRKSIFLASSAPHI